MPPEGLTQIIYTGGGVKRWVNLQWYLIKLSNHLNCLSYFLFVLSEENVYYWAGMVCPGNWLDFFFLIGPLNDIFIMHSKKTIQHEYISNMYTNNLFSIRPLVDNSIFISIIKLHLASVAGVFRHFHVAILRSIACFWPPYFWNFWLNFVPLYLLVLSEPL